MSVTQHAVFDEVGADLDEFLNKANSECHIYEVFHEQIISEGEIRWRYHEDGKDIVPMMNCNCTTGYMMPENFVHVACTREMDNEIYLLQLLYNKDKRQYPINNSCAFTADSTPIIFLTCITN